MQHRHIHAAVDRTFHDVRGSDKPFGGLSVVFGGDFQQILPVIVKGSHGQIVNACMQQSTLWHSMKVLHLTQNMQLNVDDAQERDFAQCKLTLGMAGIQISQMMYLCQNHSNVQRTLFSLSLIPSILELVYCLILKTAIFLNTLLSQVTMMMLMTLTMLSSITFLVTFKCSKVLTPLKIMKGMEKRGF